MIRQFLLASCLVLLTACGGGGGDTNTGGGSTTPPALRFSSEVVSANYRAGNASPVTLQATVNNPNDFANATAVYAYVVDPKQVLQGQVLIRALNAESYSITFYPSSLLQPGRYQDSFQVRLCKDSNCIGEFPGSPMSLRYDFTVTEAVAPLSAAPTMPTQASLHIGAPAPSDVIVKVSGDKLQWTATATAAWLKVRGGVGTGNGSFSVGFVPNGLAVGTYTENVTVSSKDGQSTNVAFSLTVLPTNFVITSGIPTFNAINGADIPAQTLSFKLDNQVASPWTASSSANWMIAGPLSGTTPGSMTLQPDPSKGPLASGDYASVITLKSPNVPDKTLSATLKLTKPTLAASTKAITLGGAKGRDFSPQPLSMTLNTGVKHWAWAVSGMPVGVTPSVRGGVVSQNGTGITLTADPALLARGSSSHVIHLTAQVNGDALDTPITVNINRDDRKLLASEYGIALSSTRSGAVLSRTIRISDNYGGNVSWTAASSAPWLSVTTGGSTGAGTALTLSANPATLTTESISYATVTITPADTGVLPVSIRVGVWKSASGAANMVKLPLKYEKLIADKIRPYIYAHDGGSSIDVFNAYNGSKVGTIPGVGAALGAMTPSPDGSTLYVLDTANRSAAILKLDTLTVTGTLPLQNAVGTHTSALAIKPNAVDVLLIGDGTAYRHDGKYLGYTGITGYSDTVALSASADGSRVFSQNMGLSPASSGGFDVDYTAVSGGILTIESKAGAATGSNGKDIAVAYDGGSVYTASGYPYKCARLEPTRLTFIGYLPGGDAYPNNIEVTYDGRAICGLSGSYSSSDFWVHSPNGTLLTGYKVAGRGLKDRQMVVTADGMIVATLAEDPLLAFVLIGP